MTGRREGAFLRVRDIMPFTYRIDRPSGAVISRGAGVVTDREVLDLMRATVADPDRCSPYRELCDLRAASEVRLDEESIERIVDYLSSRKRLMRFARIACVTSREGIFGIGQMFEARATRVPVEFMVFRDIEQAAVWLGIEIPMASEGSGAPGT